MRIIIDSDIYLIIMTSRIDQKKNTMKTYGSYSSYIFFKFEIFNLVL